MYTCEDLSNMSVHPEDVGIADATFSWSRHARKEPTLNIIVSFLGFQEPLDWQPEFWQLDFQHPPHAHA